MTARQEPGGAAGGAKGGRDARRRRRALVAWCLYDWANSAFPTVVVTFVFAVYYTTALAGTPEAGAWQWGVALGLSGLVVALFAPILGALADQGGRRKPWIGAFTVLAVLSAAGLWWVEPAVSRPPGARRLFVRAVSSCARRAMVVEVTPRGRGP